MVLEFNSAKRLMTILKKFYVKISRRVQSGQFVAVKFEFANLCISFADGGIGKNVKNFYYSIHDLAWLLLDAACARASKSLSK